MICFEFYQGIYFCFKKSLKHDFAKTWDDKIWVNDIKIENIGNIAQKNKYINSVALLKNELFNNELFGNYQNGDGFQTPISLEFVENRFWKYFTRGFTFDLLLNSETTDLPPADEDSKVIQGSNGKIYLRHSDALTNLLETNFLEKEEISFTSEYPDYWALSADITKNAIVFGYSFGFFIGIEYRFNVFHADFANFPLLSQRNASKLCSG